MTFSRLITGAWLGGGGVGIGVRDGGGVGGGKGWSNGAPYGCWRLTEGFRGGAVGNGVVIGGIILADEEGGMKNEEGFMRFVVRLVLLLDSEASSSDIRGVDAAKGGGGTCKVGIAGDETMAG